MQYLVFIRLSPDYEVLCDTPDITWASENLNIMVTFTGSLELNVKLGFWNFDCIFILGLPSLPHTPLHTPSYLLLASHATSVQLSSRFPRVSTLGSVLSPDPKLFDCSAYTAWEVSLVVWVVLVPLCHPETESKCINLCSFNLQETTQWLHNVPSLFSTLILLHKGNLRWPTS